MKTYIYYIVFLLAAFVQPLLAQDAPVTKAQPPYPLLPYTVTYEAAPTGGTVELLVTGTPNSTSVAPGEKIYSGEEVTLKITPTTGATDYKVLFGYPKVYYTNKTTKNIKLTPVSGMRDNYTFTMPKEPVTVEVKFEVKAGSSSDARLKELRYKIGEDNEIPVPSFTPGTKEYTVTLPSNTIDGTTIKLSGTAADAYATLNDSQATATLSSGAGEATFTVNAENGMTADYKVNFVKAATDKFVVTIASVEGGMITVTDATDKVIKSGDVVDNNAVLTLANTSVAGYVFSKYVVSGQQDHTGTTVTVTSDITISAEFTPPAEPKPMEDIGLPVATNENPPVPTTDAPVAIIPDAGSLPKDTELSQLRLIKEDVPALQQEDVKEKAKTAIENTGFDESTMLLMEVTLVKVTTATNPHTGTSTTTVTPVQPTDEVKVRIPYPEGVNKDSHDIKIVHLKSDGSTDVYSGGKLTLADDYMEIIVTGFSPFVVAYVTKSDPGPGPGPGPEPDLEPGTDPEPGIDPDPTPVFTVTLPAVEGAITDPVAGSYSVEAGENFRFFLTLDKDYDESQPVVTTSRNETIEPFGSTSAYIIDNIQSAVTITISGIRKNTAVSNATLDSGVRIRTEPSALYIETDRRADIRIVSISGSTLASFEAHPGTTRHPLSPGIYIVKAENEVYKVIIK